MIITLIILCIIFFSLWFYSLHQIKKSNLYIDKINNDLKIKLNDLKIKLHEKSLYLLDELDNKIKTSEESLLNKLKEINTQNQENNNKMHQQLVSGEFKRFKFDMNKTLNDMIKNVENIKFE